MNVAGTLGIGEYRAQVVKRVTHDVIGELRVVSLEWGRTLDDVSQARITGSVNGDWDTACCDLAASVRALEHELEIYRDERLVWVGPLLEPDVGRDTIVLEARDLAWWLFNARVLHSDHTFMATDLADVFNAYVADALAPDPVGLTVVATPTGILGDRSVLAADYRPAGDELNELLRTGVDMSAVGRTLHVGGRQISATPVGMLFDEHFMEDVRIKERGFDTNTKAYVLGAPGIVGIAGGVNSRVGLVEKVYSESTIEDAASATANAASRVALNGEPPLHIEVPEGARLSPYAPITIEQMIPGAAVSIGLSGMCRAVSEVQRLQKVDVTVDAGGEEAIKVTLQPIGSQ